VTALLAVGGAALLAGALLPILGPGVGASLAVQAVGMLLLGVVGVVVLLDGSPLAARFQNDVAPALGLDPLSGFFLALLALTAVPTLVFTRAYLDGIEGPGARRAVSSLMAAFLLALTGVLVARDVSVFLASWELMTMIPAATILVVRRDAAVRAAAYAYVAITHLGGVGVWLALLIAAHNGALGDPHALARAGTATQAVVAIAALVGFGTKAGFIPLHSWLPRAHPVAPAPMSALMSGMMIKVALYGLVRVEFDWLGAHPVWLGLALLAVGLLSSLGGVLWAVAQHDVKRLLAYSTIENVGIIALGLGASLLFLHADQPLWAAIAFGAAMFHTVNHAIFKTLLFLGAGAIERVVGSLELDHLGGLLRRMPWTGGAFLVGCVAIAGLPPLNGFASEWLTLQSLLHVALHGPVGLALVGAAALAGLAATAALAVLCFIKVVGLVLLGRPRTEAGAEATEPALAMRLGMLPLASMCVLLGIVPGLALPTLMGLLPGGARFAHRAGLTVPETGSLPTLGIALGLLLLTALLARVRGHRQPQPAVAPSWACGQPVVVQLGWSSAAFTKPLRLVLEALMRPRRELEVVRTGVITQAVAYSSHTPSLVDTLLVEPTVRVALRGAAVVRRLQTGNVRTYAGYLTGLVVVVLVLLGTGALS
jgi:hydrogenase-4 component B